MSKSQSKRFRILSREATHEGAVCSPSTPYILMGGGGVLTNRGQSQDAGLIREKQPALGDIEAVMTGRHLSSKRDRAS